MAPAVVIDLISDSDDEETDTPSVLASFAPRKEKAPLAPYKPALPHGLPNVPPRGDYAPKAPTARNHQHKLEAQREERVQNFERFHGRQSTNAAQANGLVGRNGGSAYTSQNSTQQESTGIRYGTPTAISTYAHTDVPVPVPVLSGHGLHILKTSEQWGLKRSSAEFTPSTNPSAKRARLEANPESAGIRKPTLDFSENSAPERMTYSDDYDIPARPTLRKKRVSTKQPQSQSQPQPQSSLIHSDDSDIPARPTPTKNKVPATKQPQSRPQLQSGQTDSGGSAIPTKIKARAMQQPQSQLHPQSTAGAVSMVKLPMKLVGPSRNGMPYTSEEDALIKKLREEDNLPWDQMVPHFNGRTSGSIQVRYSTKIKNPSTIVQRTKKIDLGPLPQREESPDTDGAVGRAKRNRKSTTREGMVSWASLKVSRNDDWETANSEDPINEPKLDLGPLSHQDSVYPSSVSRILRLRERGLTGGRAWSSRTVPEELKNHVFDEYRLRRQYHGTSGDVVSLSWSSDGESFAAGSIAITDNRSMQYNMQRNLLVGDAHGSLQELVEHHIPRPKIDDSRNVNSLFAMRESQDARLFMTVTATEFAKGSSRLFTTGTDRMLRLYTTKSAKAKCRYAIEHKASVDLLTVKTGHNLVASGCHIATNSISLFRCKKGTYEHRHTFSPDRRHQSVAIFPSALKWGIAPTHQNLLLAGFSADEEKHLASETCLSLWDANTAHPIELRTVTRNVFDVAWNPSPSSASISFAVAAGSTSATFVAAGSKRSIVQCFAPNQNQARSVIAFECPALDINDLVFCPHDDNLIAAGATNGNVYVWDLRSAKKQQQPLHVLQHGDSENVLAHEHDRELADTGVRFLSWGATSSRLYSGSSDGIVKIWNPSRGSPHVDDLETAMQQRSAIMSGSFSPSYETLLIGTENGQIRQFNIGGHQAAVQPFKLRPAPAPTDEKEDPFEPARSLLQSQQLELRPLGAMPIRQAVQGPKYQGPYLAPPPEDVSDAMHAYQLALATQQDQVQVRAAEQRFRDLQDRMEHFSRAEPKARKFQTALLRDQALRILLVEKAGSDGDVEGCKLDCAVLGPGGEEEAEDSGRSEMRIPGALRAVRRAETGEEGDGEADCYACFPLNATRGKKKILCAACMLKKARLTAECSRCSGPTRVDLEGKRDAVCERCAFACFRCAAALELGGDLEVVRCRACDLEWEAGVLGYELSTSSRGKAAKGKRAARVTRGDRGEARQVGTGLMEYYASLWEDKRGEGPY